MNIDFTLAKSKHLAWRVRLMGFLNGQESLTTEQVTSHEQCDFGKWIYSTGLEKYGHLENMQNLEEAHRLLHDTIAKVVSLKNENKSDLAEKEYEQMKNVSELLMQLIDTLEKQVS
ncbi:MAG: CZB domain-containing protein [Thermonemataceae bacterium]|nr:CZB domain-containing protein [Thermonemataceae bacterium]